MSGSSGVMTEEADRTRSSAAVRFEGVVKRSGDFTAVDGIDLEIREGEFFSILARPARAKRPACA